MSGLLAGRSVIVLGADEIGAGIAQRLELAGASVALLGEAPDDAATQAAVAAAALRLCGLYGLVNNLLPTPTLGALEQQPSTAFASAFASVQQAAAAMQAALPLMQAGGEGRIVTIGHRYGESVNEGLAAYNAAAASLIGLSRSAALDWGRYQIASNVLLPFADTAEFRRARVQRSTVVDLLLSQVPLRRAGDCVADIGGAVLFLMSEAGRFINGEVLHADGGQHIAGPVINRVKFSQA